MTEKQLLKERLKNLTPDQIRKLMAKSTGSGASADYRMPRNGEGIYPLSRAQERIWFLSQLYPDSALYNIPLAIRLRSAISLDLLKDSLNRIVRENEALRTTFRESEGRVVQQVHDSLDVHIEYEDISGHVPQAEMDAAIEEIGAAHGRTLFDLSELPLFTVKLVKLAEADYVLFFNLHHLISDGWTNSLLARDSNLFYGASTGTAPDGEKYQYIDYVKWEQQWLASPRYANHLEFWKAELQELPETFKFPRDFQSDDHSYEGRRESRHIPHALHDRVTAYCQKNDMSAFQFYISCYALLLFRYSGNDDFVIGTPVANRNQRHFQNTYGVFINSLPLRFRIDDGRTTQETLEAFKGMIRQCMDHQEVPFSEIISAINPQRKLHENPLYNVHFAYQHFPQRKKSDEHALLPIDYLVSKFDVNFWVEIAGDERTISVTYKDELIGKDKIDRFLQHYLLLATALLENLDAPVGELDFIPAEHRSLLAGERTEYKEASWLDLFRESVGRCSDETAIVDEQGRLSYEELNARALALAGALAEKGVRKGDVVAVRTGRNRNFVLAILACMDCGAAYLPIDPRVPPGRFAHLLSDSGAKLVLAEDEIEGVDCLGFAADGATSGSAAFEGVNVSGEDVAYVIYTSGTSGKPKGVCVPHRALLNYTHAMRHRIGDAGIRSFAHVSALDADLGNTSIFLALGFGGALAMPDADALLDPESLAAFFRECPVDVMKIVPSHLNALSENLSGILPGKLLVCGGERLDSPLVSQVRNTKPSLRIINHYGPAEATIGSLTFELPEDFDGHLPPIGRPIDNSSVMLADKNLNMVPRGVPGEICLAGSNVALGYLYRPELTAGSFVHAPALAPGPVYRTGDIGYLDEDGQIVFVERLDRQVKINGFRIEPGEIEAVLKAHESVMDACVFVTDGEGGQRKLVAAVKPRGRTDGRQFRACLAEYFSQAVIPSIHLVDEIPLTRNGKVDVERTKEMCENLSAAPEWGAPRDIVEVRLLEIFKATLNVASVRPDDQFFDLGGHSLLAIKLIAQINKAFRTDFRIDTLFQYGSVRELASLVRKASHADPADASAYVRLVDKGQERKFVWIHPAGGNVMSYYPIANAFSDAFDSAAFTAMDHHLKTDLSIKGLAEDYAAELQAKAQDTGAILAGWSMGALIAHEMAVRFAANGEQRPLILVDQPVPHHGAGSFGSYEERLIGYIEKIGVFTGEALRLSDAAETPIDYEVLYGEFIRLNLMPEEVSVSEFRLFLDVLVKHNQIISDFYPSVYSGPTLLLKAAEKIMLKTSNPQPEYFQNDLGWSAFCPELTIIEVPGNHITMLRGENAVSTARLTREWVDCFSGRGVHG